jgi:hypothetical protein
MGKYRLVTLGAGGGGGRGALYTKSLKLYAHATVEFFISPTNHILIAGVVDLVSSYCKLKLEYFTHIFASGVGLIEYLNQR